jgi:hypothetical protein
MYIVVRLFGFLHYRKVKKKWKSLKN